MEYRIVLTRMEFHALHGCYELERKVGNRFTVDLELTAELGHAATDDDVRKTVNYLTAYEVVEMQMRITQHTIERVATNIIEAVYATFPQVRHAAAGRKAREGERRAGEIGRVCACMRTPVCDNKQVRLCITRRVAPPWVAN